MMASAPRKYEKEKVEIHATLRTPMMIHHGPVRRTLRVLASPGSAWKMVRMRSPR